MLLQLVIEAFVNVEFVVGVKTSPFIPWFGVAFSQWRHLEAAICRMIPFPVLRVEADRLHRVLRSSRRLSRIQLLLEVNM